MNSKHVLITGLACVVAGIFFFITMLAAPSPKQASNTGGSTIVALDGWEKANLGANTSAPNVKRLEIHFADDHGVQYDLMGQSLTPKSKGVIDVVKPIARIHLKPNRSVIQIEADQGTFIVPTNETRTGMIGTIGDPTSGFLKGNVKIRLFENDGIQPIELIPGSTNEILTLAMEQANFDRDLGQIQADGLVKLDGRDAAFEGENLNIIYSPLLQRINRLEIEKGKFIRIKQVNQPGQTRPLQPEQEQPQTVATTQPSDATTQPATTQPKAKRPAQYYHITLNDHVAIEAQHSKLTGNLLELFIGMEGADKKDTAQENKSDESNSDANQPAAIEPAPKVVDNPDDDVLITWTGPLLMLPTEGKPEMLAHARDAYLKLVGTPMQITPPGKDIITASSIDYLLSQTRLRINSSETYPLLIDSPQLGGLITAKNYEMYLDKGLGILQGEGDLRGLSRTVLAQTGDADGKTNEKSLTPGTSIHWLDRVELVFYPDESRANGKSQTDFDAVQTITFRGKVDVQHDQFDVLSDLITIQLTRPTRERKKQDASVIEAVGNVALRTHSTDPQRQLALKSDKATIRFSPSKTGKMLPSLLTANDNVIIRRPQQVLWSEKLAVELGHGKPEPVAMAPQSPEDENKDQTPAKPADALDTMLAWEEKSEPVPTVVPSATTQPDQAVSVATEDNAATEKDDDKLYLKRVTVEGDVRARLINNDQQVYAFANRIIGDDNQVELFGNDKRPAQVVQDAGILAGDHMVLTPKNQNLHVIGKGTLSYLSNPLEDKPEVPSSNGITKPAANLNTEPVSALNVDGTTGSTSTTTTTTTTQSDKPDVPADDTKTAQTNEVQPDLPTLEPARVRVQWQDNMHYNHQTLQARFLGNVNLTATRTNAATTVKGNDITVLFNKFIHDNKEQTKAVNLDDSKLPAMNEDGMVSTSSLSGGRQVRMVNVKGNAEFLEESWAPAVANNERTLLTRLRLAGEDMIFDALPETITIPGPGTLLHQDHRPKVSSSDKGRDVQFTGRGQTLFRWKDQFLLDIAHNDMIMKDYVQMLHIPEDSDNGIQLDCRTFLADMQATGGLGTWLSGNPPTPDLKVVQASRDVRITAQNRQITTDRATYIHDVRKVKLQADENKLTRITTPSGTSSPGAELIIWELDTNRFYIVNPGRVNEVAPKRKR